MGLLIDRDDAMVALKELKRFDANINDNSYNIAIDKCVDKLRTFPAEIGLDGWELARKVEILPIHIKEKLYPLSKAPSLMEISKKYSPLEVERILKDYEENEVLKVGDIIYAKIKGEDSEHFIVLKIVEDTIILLSGYDFSILTLGKRNWDLDYSKFDKKDIDTIKEMFEK